MDNINTEEKAYWLGFFYADAYNKEKTGQIIIELQERDKDHLYKCAKFFGKPREPFKQLKNKGKYIAYRLELNGRILSNSLKNRGCHGTKSFSITFPDWLRKKLIPHFIRGYFDGDGCLYIHQNQMMVEIVSTKEMNKTIRSILQKYRINSQLRTRKKYSGNTTILEFGGSRQVKRFCDWIYKEATIYLDRKHDLFKSYCENHKFRFDN
jgi:intein/homing endonuclease